MPTMIELMNTIRDNASDEYTERVPVATQANITAVSAPLLSYTMLQNEFLSALINKIALTLVHNKTLTNPLAVLKKGGMPLGQDMEEIYINPATAETFDGTATANVFAQRKADVHTLYHRINRRDTYTVTISDAQLQTAFTSWDKLSEFISALVNTLYSGDNYDEFVLMKQMLETAIDSNEIIKISTTAITNEATTKDFVKAIKTTSNMMAFPSSTFNSHYAVQKAADALYAGKPIITWTPVEDQILILRADIMAQIDVEVLAVAFNMNKVDLQARILTVDSFGEEVLDKNVYAILADKAWVQVYDNLITMKDQYNGKGLYWNYFYHHWQTYSYSLFCNAVAFVEA